MVRSAAVRRSQRAKALENEAAANPVPAPAPALAPAQAPAPTPILAASPGPAAFNPTVVMFNQDGSLKSRSYAYTTADGSTYKPVLTFGAEVEEEDRKHARAMRQKLLEKQKSRKEGTSSGASGKLRSTKTARKLYMEFYREGCRAWYYRESIGEAEKRLSTYWEDTMGFAEEQYWEGKAAAYNATVDLDNAATKMSAMMNVGGDEDLEELDEEAGKEVAHDIVGEGSFPLRSV